jgi:hypothetical protein
VEVIDGNIKKRHPLRHLRSHCAHQWLQDLLQPYRVTQYSCHPTYGTQDGIQADPRSHVGCRRRHCVLQLLHDERNHNIVIASSRRQTHQSAFGRWLGGKKEKENHGYQLIYSDPKFVTPSCARINLLNKPFFRVSLPRLPIRFREREKSIDNEIKCVLNECVIENWKCEPVS